jgi:hypothetical protein
VVSVLDWITSDSIIKGRGIPNYTSDFASQGRLSSTEGESTSIIMIQNIWLQKNFVKVHNSCISKRYQCAKHSPSMMKFHARSSGCAHISAMLLFIKLYF